MGHTYDTWQLYKEALIMPQENTPTILLTVQLVGYSTLSDNISRFFKCLFSIFLIFVILDSVITMELFVTYYCFCWHYLCLIN